MITMRRKPRWKRMLQSPLTWYRHYVMLRRINDRRSSAITAVRLTYVVVRG